ncbi:MAG: hypothetical protein RM021_024200 [Nostoc sp. EkiNYC01]|nr:hypothetical protein [Nostoc sp. EkiNYC01]
MITLSIQQFAEDNNLSLEELSQHSNVALEDIQSYAIIETLTDEIATNLRKIASELNVSVLELVKPILKQGALRFKIFEMIQNKDLTIEELSKLSGVHPAIVAFYSTQPINEHKFNEMERKNKYLTKISEVIGCSTEELKVETDQPIIKLDVKKWAEKRGLNLDDISLLTGLPLDFIDLISTQYIDEPIDISCKESSSRNLLGFMSENLPAALLPPQKTPKEIFCQWLEITIGKTIWICK